MTIAEEFKKRFSQAVEYAGDYPGRVEEQFRSGLSSMQQERQVGLPGHLGASQARYALSTPFVMDALSQAGKGLSKLGQQQQLGIDEVMSRIGVDVPERKEVEPMGIGIPAVLWGILRGKKVPSKARTKEKGEAGTSPKVIGTDAAGRSRYDWRGAQVFHFTDEKSANDIANYGYRVVSDGYYGEAVSFTNNEDYGRQFGGEKTVAKVANDANIVEISDPRISEVLNDRNLVPNKGGERQTWKDRFLELGIDGVYDPGAGDLFIYNTDKVGYVGHSDMSRRR